MDLKIVITDALRGVRRRLPRRCVKEASAVIERYGGYANASVITTLPFEQGQALGIQDGDCLEIWDGGIRQYRGYVTSLSPSLGDPALLVIGGYGRALNARKQRGKRNYAFPENGVDVSIGFAKFVSDSLSGQVCAGGAPLLGATDIQPVGTSTSAFQSRDLTSDQVLSDLETQTGNTAVWGYDVDALGNDRLYLRPVNRSTNADWSLPADSRRTTSLGSDSQSADVVNRLLVIGGQPTYPNLVHNASFELPIVLPEGLQTLILNGGFEQGAVATDNNVYEWIASGGASVQQHVALAGNFGQPYEGQNFLQLDHVSEAVYQQRATTLNSGHDYTFAFRVANQRNGFPAHGQAQLQIFDGSSSVLLSQTLDLPGLGSNWDYHSATFSMPAGAASYRVDLSVVSLGPGASGGVLYDDVQLYQADQVYQEGWTLAAYHGGFLTPSAATVGPTNWVCEGDVIDGGYAVQTSTVVTGSDTEAPGTPPAGAYRGAANCLKLIPPLANRIKVDQGKSYAQSAWVKVLAGDAGIGGAWVIVGHEHYGAGGYVGDELQYKFVPADGAWHQVAHTLVGGAGLIEVRPFFGMATTGAYLWDACMFVDASQDTSVFYDEGPLKFYVAASDAALAAAYPAAAALYSGSEAAYGGRFDTVTVSQVRLRSDALAVANSRFLSDATAYSRPTAVRVDDPRPFWPGQAVRFTGEAGEAVAPAALPIVRVSLAYSDGLLKKTLELAREQPNQVTAVRKIVLGEFKSLGVLDGQSGSGTGGGYADASNRNPSGAPGGTPLATATTTGTVKTDITESGGSVVYSKGTADALLTAEATARAAADALALQKGSNLSDLPSAATARGNLGLGTAATRDVPGSGNASASQVVLGNDTRLSGSLARASASVTTSSLAAGATDTSQRLTVGKSGFLGQVMLDKAAWVRIYATPADQTADNARQSPGSGNWVPAGPGTTGLVAEFNSLTGQTINLSRLAAYMNLESPPVGTLVCSIQNNSGTTATITLTAEYLSLES